ncbi:MAG: carboxymuconolactone decarboxylase family protein [Sphingobacteriales bacterium]|nr:MAG: carboxymuconolactone decarboxylase family protein [Sphingobacteriales bacterium]
MEQRISLWEKGQGAVKAMWGINSFLAKSGLEQSLLNLMYFRVSQINGCAYCLDMHAKDMRAAGESEQRLYMIAAWEESPVYTSRERAALAWAEAVTELHKGHVPDEVYETVRKEFSEEEIIALTMALVAINGYNRMNVAFRTHAGSYEPGQFAAAH